MEHNEHLSEESLPQSEKEQDTDLDFDKFLEILERLPELKTGCFGEPESPIKGGFISNTCPHCGKPIYG